MLSGQGLFRCKTLDLLFESDTEEAQQPGWAQNQVFVIQERKPSLQPQPERHVKNSQQRG